jgi:hypothetical protein
MRNRLRFRHSLIGVLVLALLLGCASTASASFSSHVLNQVKRYEAKHAKAAKKKKKKSNRGPRGPRGPQGPAGPVGPTGPQGPVGPQGPGATRSAVFLTPTPGDGIHHVNTTGAIQWDVSCRAVGAEEIEWGLFLSIPSVPALLSAAEKGSSQYIKIFTPVTDLGSYSKVEPGKSTGEGALFWEAGPDGIPHLLWVDEGANTKASTSVGPPATESPRGCWFYTIEL